MYSKSGCMKVSSNCVVWEGPDIPCLKLCKGDTITDVLYKLATDYCETLVMLDPTTYDISCFNYLGVPPEDFGDTILDFSETNPFGEPGGAYEQLTLSDYEPSAISLDNNLLRFDENTATWDAR